MQPLYVPGCQILIYICVKGVLQTSLRNNTSLKKLVSVTVIAVSLSVFHPLDASLLCLAVYALHAGEGNSQVIFPCVFNEVITGTQFLTFFGRKGLGKC